MKTAKLDIIKNVFTGAKPHEATFVFLTLEDGSTAPLGRIKTVAVQSEEDAREWAAANAIRVVQ
jgi:hypothetical protein